MERPKRRAWTANAAWRRGDEGERTGRSRATGGEELPADQACMLAPEHSRVAPRARRRRTSRLLPGGIQHGLFLLLLVVLLPILVVETAIHYTRLEARRAQELQTNLELARVAAQLFDNYVQDILRQERTIGLAIALSRDLSAEHVSGFLASNSNQDPTIQYISWVDPRGRIVASSEPESLGQDIGDQAYFPYFKEITEGREWAVSDLYAAKATGAPAFVIARGIRHEGGALQGVVLAAVNPHRLDEVLTPERAGQASIAILDTQSRLVYRFPELDVTWERRTHHDSLPVISRALAGEEVTDPSTISPVDGRKRMAGLAPIRRLGWAVVAGRPVEEIMNPLIHDLIKELGVILLVAVAAFLAALTIGRNLTVPMSRLREHALAIGRGDLGRRLEVFGPAEVEELAVAFNRMAEEIRVREAQRQRANEALHTQLKQISTIFDSLNAVVYVADVQTHELLFINTCGADLFGTYIPGKPCFQGLQACLAGPCPFCTNDQMTLRGMSDTPNVWEFQNTVTGTWFLCVDKAMPWTDGRPVRLEIAVDITERKRMEERLLRAQRLELAGTLASQIGHDLTNLLGPFLGYPELIKMRLRADHPAVKYCDAMLEIAPQIAEINQDLLSMSRRGHFNREPLNLNRLVNQAIAQMSPPPDTLTIELALRADLLTVNGSAAQMMRVISNLLSNARDAMSDAGLLSVRTETVHLDKPPGRSDRLALGDYVVLDVQDTGSGIAPEIMAKIFDPFFTTKRANKRSGSGLGLSIVDAIVGDHGGHVGVTSDVGKGTTFSVFLPVYQEAPGKTPNIKLQ